MNSGRLHFCVGDGVRTVERKARVLAPGRRRLALQPIQRAVVLAVCLLLAQAFAGCTLLEDPAEESRHEACLAFVAALQFEQADREAHEETIARLSREAAKHGREAANVDDKYLELAASLERYRDQEWREGDQGTVVQACNAEAESRN